MNLFGEDLVVDLGYGRTLDVQALCHGLSIIVDSGSDCRSRKKKKPGSLYILLVCQWKPRLVIVPALIAVCF